MRIYELFCSGEEGFGMRKKYLYMASVDSLLATLWCTRASKFRRRALFADKAAPKVVKMIRGDAELSTPDDEPAKK